MCVLQHYLQDFNKTGRFVFTFLVDEDAPEPAEMLPDTPALLEAQKAAAQAAETAPETALYWQTVGDFLTQTNREKAPAAYEKAVSGAPKNTNILYRLYEMPAQCAPKSGRRNLHGFAGLFASNPRPRFFQRTALVRRSGNFV